MTGSLESEDESIRTTGAEVSRSGTGIKVNCVAKTAGYVDVTLAVHVNAQPAIIFWPTKTLCPQQLAVWIYPGNEDVFATSASFIPGTFSLVLGLASLPIFLFYILKDSEKLKIGLSSSLSP